MPDFLSFWWMSVRARAMLRRTCFSFSVFVSCWVARCIRRPNCSFSSAASSVLSSSGDLAASAFVLSVRFIVISVSRR